MPPTEEEPKRLRVAVIGAGALGLIAMKNFVEDGFDVTGFETRSYLGGLWKDSHDSSISVHATTAFNSSKYRSAISDFPFPEDADDFPTAVQMHRYLTGYAVRFGLDRRVRLGVRVVGMEREGDMWVLQVRDSDGEVRAERFDKVAVATGSFHTPKTVRFDGVDMFAGDVIHSINYHGSEPYAGKNVLVIGIHASAQDVAVSLRETASKIYMSHRNGLILMPRYMPDGAVYDKAGTLQVMLIQVFMMTWMPRFWTWIFDKIIMSLSAQAFKIKPEWGFPPAQSLAVSTPLIGDKLYELLNSGFATAVTEVDRITGHKTVLLKNGMVLEDIDAIIQCTGYDFAIPFIPESSPYQPYPKVGSPPRLYRNIFPIHEDSAVRNSLAFLGQVGLTFPGFVAFELAAQSISQIWRGRVGLPPLAEMQDWHKRNLAWRAEMIRVHGHSSTFYSCAVPFADHLRWLDRTAGTGIFMHFNWAWFNWRSWRLWWQDPKLYNICVKGLFTPAIFRLFDCGGRKPWAGARTQVFEDNKVVARQIEGRRKLMQKDKEL